jgi:hypothetical protein
MSNYSKTTNFAAKDSLPSGNTNKIVRGTEIDTEFNNIATAIATSKWLLEPISVVSMAVSQAQPAKYPSG